MVYGQEADEDGREGGSAKEVHHVCLCLRDSHAPLVARARAVSLRLYEKCGGAGSSVQEPVHA